MAEELGLQQIRRDRRAIHRDEGLLSLRARVVNASREEPLPRSRLPHDEHGRAPAGRDAHRELDGLKEGGAPTDDGLETDIGGVLARGDRVGLDFPTGELVTHGSDRLLQRVNGPRSAPGPGAPERL